MSGIDTEVEKGDAGASMTVPIQAGSLKKGMFCMLKGNPCKISEISFSKTGKHGHAKASITGYDIFTNRKYEDACPSSHNMEQPVVSKAEYQLVDITADGYMSLLDTEKGETKDDIKVPDNELGADIRARWTAGAGDIIVAVVKACGMEAADGVKESR